MGGSEICTERKYDLDQRPSMKATHSLLYRKIPVPFMFTHMALQHVDVPLDIEQDKKHSRK